VVDLANMMLVLALRTSPEMVYQEAQQLFSPEEIAEAFAATRGITVPSPLRAEIRKDGRDLVQPGTLHGIRWAAIAASIRRLLQRLHLPLPPFGPTSRSQSRHLARALLPSFCHSAVPGSPVFRQRL